MRGKTAGEVADLVANLTNVSRQMYDSIRARENTPTQPAPLPEIDEDLWLSDPKQAERLLEQRVLAQVTQASQPILESNSRLARELVSTNPKYKRDFERWGSEIDGLVGKLRPDMRTSEAYMQAARVVRGTHVDEIEREIASKYKSGSGVISGDGRGGAPGDDGDVTEWADFEKSEIGRRMLERVSKSEIRRAARSMGHTVREYGKLVAASKASPDPDAPGRWFNKGMSDRA